MSENVTKAAPKLDRDLLPAPAGIMPDLDETALLLDIDGTLIELAPTPRDIIVPPKLGPTLLALHDRLDGALALVSGRSLTDIDVIFAPLQFPAVGGHGAEMRLSTDEEAVDTHAPPMDNDLKRRFIAISQLSPGILLEDKGYSIALHYRLARTHGHELQDRVMRICAADPTEVEVLPGKAVIEVKSPMINKGTGVRELMRHPPFRGRRPIFIGDDVTDEAAFAVLPEFTGVGFSVGRAVPGLAGFFPGPSDVRRWLYQMAGEDITAEEGVSRS
jgi:trehalose 6-phosphate phosphatase